MTAVPWSQPQATTGRIVTKHSRSDRIAEGLFSRGKWDLADGLTAALEIHGKCITCSATTGHEREQ